MLLEAGLCLALDDEKLAKVGAGWAIGSVECRCI
jgi:hypothetical protein